MGGPVRAEVDRSVTDPDGVRWAALGLGLLALIVGGLLYGWWSRGPARLADVVVLGGVLVVLLHRALTRCTCELRPEGARFTSRAPLRRRTVDVPYDQIVGVYPYRPRLIGAVRFRRTFRMHSLVDTRDVWSLAYQVARAGGRTEHRRIQFKCSEGWLDALAGLAPQRVRVPEEDVVRELLRGG